jgi:hypothetical protein
MRREAEDAQKLNFDLDVAQEQRALTDAEVREGSRAGCGAQGANPTTSTPGLDPRG